MDNLLGKILLHFKAPLVRLPAGLGGTKARQANRMGDALELIWEGVWTMKLAEMSYDGWVWLCAEFSDRLIWIKAICKVGECHRSGGG